MKKQQFGFITTIAMIVGIVVGSGIYFKADDILTFTGGNLWLGILVLTIGSSGIIFGSLSLSELAQRTNESGGIANYFEQFVKPEFAAAMGFLQTFVYLPSITAIVSWVAGIYTWILLGVDATFEMQILLGFGYLVLFSLVNLLSSKLSGQFQSLSTFVKLIPLIAVAIIGLFWSQPLPEIPANYTVVPVKSVGLGWIAALVPLAFSYDGWTVVLNIAPEIKNPEKNLRRALFVGPIVIWLVYVLYFSGLTNILGASFIMSTGNDAVTYAMNLLFGETISKLLLVIVILSVLGVSNGMILGGSRMPQALAERGWIKYPALTKTSKNSQISAASLFLYSLTCSFWLVMHYITQKTGVLSGSDVSEVSVVFVNGLMIILYLTVFRLYKKGIVTNRLTGFVSPIIASIGTLALVIGSFIVSPFYTSIFIVFGLVVCFVGVSIYRRTEHHS